MRFSNRARRVTSFVTKGLPSRSPPIQEPNWKNGATCQCSVGYACRSARSSLSTSSGTTSKRFSWTKYNPHASSCSTVGFSSRSSPVSHSSSRSEEHTSELQSHSDLVCRLLLEKKKKKQKKYKE